MTQSPAHASWMKKWTGALCFIKDNIRKSYFFRLYCLKANRMVWEQEIYNGIEVTKPRPFLMVFEGQVRPKIDLKTNLMNLTYLSSSYYDRKESWRLTLPRMTRRLHSWTRPSQRYPTETGEEMVSFFCDCSFRFDVGKVLPHSSLLQDNWHQSTALDAMYRYAKISA